MKMSILYGHFLSSNIDVVAHWACCAISSAIARFVVFSRLTSGALADDIQPPQKLFSGYYDKNDFTAPSLATDGNGTWVIVVSAMPAYSGSDIDVYTSFSTDGGVSWAPFVVIADYMKTDPVGYTARDFSPSVAYSPGVGFVAAWASNVNYTGTVNSTSDDEILSAFSTNGMNWSLPHQVNPVVDAHDDGFPVVSAKGNTWMVVWRRLPLSEFGAKREIVVSYSTDNGTNWTYPVTLTRILGPFSGIDSASYGNLWVNSYGSYPTGKPSTDGIFVQVGDTTGIGTSTAWSNARGVTSLISSQDTVSTAPSDSSTSIAGSQDFSSISSLGDPQWFVVSDYNPSPTSGLSVAGIMGFRARITSKQSSTVIWVSAASNADPATPLFRGSVGGDVFMQPKLTTDSAAVWVCTYTAYTYTNYSRYYPLIFSGQQLYLQVSKNNGKNWTVMNSLNPLNYAYSEFYGGYSRPTVVTDKANNYILAYLKIEFCVSPFPASTLGVPPCNVCTVT